MSTDRWTLSLSCGLLMAASAAGALGGPRPSVAVLPFLPADASHPREGWAVSVKLIGRIERRYDVVAVDWKSLGELMEREGLDKKRLLDAAQLAAIGRALHTDGVVSGTFVTTGSDALARPIIVSAASGRARKGSDFRFRRDFTVPVPEFFVDAPAPLEDIPDLRDSVVDYHPCQDAGARVDELESRILDLKARYWASQLAKGVHMGAIKFNPGSTISDPDLKREFYAKMKSWTKESHIPELSPSEIKEFAEVDAEAIALARRCGIL